MLALAKTPLKPEEWEPKIRSPGQAGKETLLDYRRAGIGRKTATVAPALDDRIVSFGVPIALRHNLGPGPRGLSPRAATWALGRA